MVAGNQSQPASATLIYQTEEKFSTMIQKTLLAGNVPRAKYYTYASYMPWLLVATVS